MMKSGAPPDKFGVLYRMITYRIPWFQSRINSKGYHSLVPGLISISGFLSASLAKFAVTMSRSHANFSDTPNKIYYKKLTVKYENTTLLPGCAHRCQALN